MKLPGPLPARRRLAALLEVLGVYLAGGVVTELIILILQLPVTNPLPGLHVDISDAALLTATWQLGGLLLLQYAGWFLLIVPLRVWQLRRQDPPAHTRPTQSWRALVLAGTGTAAVAAIPLFGFTLLDKAYHLGETVPWRQALLDMSWGRWEFWVFMAVASWGLVATLEELFFRGYCQRRLAEAWGHGPAIVGVTSLFVFAHAQYLSPSLYNAGMVVSLLCLSLGLGVIYAATGSIIPSMVAHALINLPLTPAVQAVALAAGLVVGAFTWRTARHRLRDAFKGARLYHFALLALAGAAWAVASRHFSALSYLAIGCVLIAIILQSRERPESRLQPT